MMLLYERKSCCGANHHPKDCPYITVEKKKEIQDAKNKQWADRKAAAAAEKSSTTIKGQVHLQTAKSKEHQDDDNDYNLNFAFM